MLWGADAKALLVFCKTRVVGNIKLTTTAEREAKNVPTRYKIIIFLSPFACPNSFIIIDEATS